MVSRDDLRQALVSLNEGWQDADAVAEDLLRPPRERELGPVLARRNYADARAKLVTALAYLMRIASDRGDGGPHGPSGEDVAPAR